MVETAAKQRRYGTGWNASERGKCEAGLWDDGGERARLGMRIQGETRDKSVACSGRDGFLAVGLAKRTTGRCGFQGSSVAERVASRVNMTGRGKQRERQNRECQQMATATRKKKRRASCPY